MATPDPHAVPAGETHATTQAEHGGGGLPQFQFQHWAGQIGYLLILFVVLYLLMSRVFTPRLRKVIDERADTIAGALEQARKVQEEAGAQAAKAQADLADARAKAHKLAADARAKAAADAQARQAAEDAKLAEKMAEAETRIRALGEYSRRPDIACRIGGEEFFILAPETALPGGLRQAERLRSAFEGKTITVEGIDLQLTVSVGVAQKTPGMATPEELLKLADEALYRAKREGRNRVISAPLV